MNKIEVPTEQLEELLRQNDEMRELITNCFVLFVQIDNLINLNDTLNTNQMGLMLKLPSILRDLKKNAHLFEFLNKEFLQKIEKYANTGKN